jgi:Zn-dependent protease
LSPEQAIPVLVVLILSLSFHEAAHAWAADRLGDPTARLLGRLTMNPIAHIDWIGTVLFPVLALSTGSPFFIGWAKPVPVNMQNLPAPRRDFAMVAAAGPLSNLVLAGAATLVIQLTGISPQAAGGDLPGRLLTLMILVNVFLAVFNLLPIPPLDGGNVLAGIVPEHAARLIDQIRPYGFLILLALLFTGTLDPILGPASDYVLSWFL